MGQWEVQVVSDSSSVSTEHFHWDKFLKSGLCVVSKIYIVASVKKGTVICQMSYKILTSSSPEGQLL